VGFWPEDQWDYSPEADARRAAYKKELELYEQTRKKDPIAETYRTLLKDTSFNFDLDRMKRAVKSDSIPIPHCTTVNELEQFIKKIIKEEI
jgi:hypothetical protein